ncbi:MULTISPECIES: hypothetical protein [unclassified Psychrobacter]|uniref:hypothetical protein n=1 Tax=unclassified Psychrobacter TaxID=196806 RepID=UPI00041C0224|nr:MULTISPECIES: hypothetical protein [unclassified Psychrobacter]PKG34233.1 hypothetical protein CXF65_14810 [Psychrobacter sp. Sarcosine-3u-12]
MKNQWVKYFTDLLERVEKIVVVNLVKQPLYDECIMTKKLQSNNAEFKAEAVKRRHACRHSNLLYCSDGRS